MCRSGRATGASVRRAPFSLGARAWRLYREPFYGDRQCEGGAEGDPAALGGRDPGLVGHLRSGRGVRLRNRAIILLFLDTGMRYAELHQLILADVSWEDGRIHIRHGKGRNSGVVPFGDGPAAALRDYVERFRGEGRGADCF